MREILFRGKRKDGQWIYGSLLKVTYDGNTYNLIFADNFLFVFGEVTAMEHAAVDPSTVGQFTGLTDKNGKKIFEGDVVKGGYGCASGVVTFGEGTFDSGIYRYIGWHVREADGGVDMNELYQYSGEGFTVIGNIYDNPELLEGNQ